jgi:hypothetical protein
MSFKKIVGIVISIFAFTLMLNEAYAGIEVKCETRGNYRSKISVDGTGLTGTYYAIVYSAPPYTTAVRSKLPNKVANSSHQVEFDFDSNPYDISQGATKISPTFIKNHKTWGFLRKSDNTPAGSWLATCVAK